jgi:putative membrane protein insertion efficiency factor
MSSPEAPIDEKPAPPTIGAWLVSLPARGAIALVRGYQFLLRPLFGGQCRFHPSCSEYFILAVEKYGVISGSCRGIWRIMRCHPFQPGGYDPP